MEVLGQQGILGSDSISCGQKARAGRMHLGSGQGAQEAGGDMGVGGLWVLAKGTKR